MFQRKPSYRLDAGHAARPSRQGRRILRALRTERIHITSGMVTETTASAADAAAVALKSMGVMEDHGLDDMMSLAGVKRHSFRCQ